MPIAKNGPTPNGDEEMKVLRGKEEEAEEEASADPEKATAENGRTKGEKAAKRSERQLLLGPEEIERYRKDPLWKALRFALFGSLVCLFFLLVVVAVLIVAFSSKCAGGDEIGGTTKTIDLLVGGGTDERTKFAKGFAVISVREGESASFHCDNSGRPIRWHRNGQNAEEIGEQSRNTVLFNNGTLHIRNAQLEDTGEYICEGTAPFGKEWHRLETVKLEVAHGKQALQQSVPSASSPHPPRPSSAQLFSLPRVDSHLKLAFAGETVHFRCWMDGKSSDDLSWQKVTTDAQRRETGAVGDGLSLLATEPDGHSAFLMFGAVKESDAGEYKCVEGHSGVSSPPVRLRVEPSRTPVIEPREQSVPEHSPARIRCSVPGHPNAQLIWRRENGVEVGTIKGVADDGKGTLRIAQMRREHARMGWVCWAVYSQRADKQALSAGPVVINVIGGQEESGPGEETTEQQRDEEGSGQEEGGEESGKEAEQWSKEGMEVEKGEENSESEAEQSKVIEQGEGETDEAREGEAVQTTREWSETANAEGEEGQQRRDDEAEGAQTPPDQDY